MVLRICGVLLAVLIGVAAPAGADVFRVSGVVVEAEANSASEARERALASGQLTAANQLVERLTLPQDRAFLPPLDVQTAGLLVAGVEVVEDNPFGDRYVGLLNFEFDPGQVRGYLRTNGVPYVETRTRPMVVVPLWYPDGQPRLWEANPWLMAWRNANLAEELVPLVAPSGDLEDIAALDAARARALNGTALRALAARYGAERVLVAHASPASVGARVTLTEVSFERGQAEVIQLGPAGPDAFEPLVAAVSQRLQDQWKRRAVVRDDQTQTIKVSVVFRDLSEWRRLQESIGAASLVTDPRLDAVARGGAAMTVTHVGAIDQLLAELAERGVRMERDATDGWVASLTGAPAQAPQWRR